MKSNLSQIFRIRKFLDDIKYPDSKRISTEISEYVNIKRNLKEEKIFNRLHKDEPWEYIRGYTQFCDTDFLVSKDTLIPRIETEQLVYNSVKLIQKFDIKNIVDIGTGTGCIAISISKLLSKKNIPHSIYATDVSTKVLNIAKKNEELLKKKKIKWVKTDLIKDIDIVKGKTLFVANLPYIPTDMYLKLDKSVLNYEPRVALDGGKDGLKLYRKLLEQLKEKNYNNFLLYIETEESIVDKTKELLLQYYPKAKCTMQKDCFDRKRFLLLNTL